MLKDERPGDPFGPIYTLENGPSISRNYHANKTSNRKSLYHLSWGRQYYSFSEEEMLEFFAAFILVKESYDS